MSGADYSYARPGGALLAASGIVSVGRYVGNPGDGRCLTAAEYADLTGHGVSVWLIREADGQEMLGGYNAGVAQAQIAQAAIIRLGLPADSVVYFTADFAVQPYQYQACDDYLRGAASVLGSSGRIGLYAGVPYLIHVKSWGGAAYWWKPGASSWSAGQSTDLHIEQLVGTAAGIAGTDANIIYQADHGQIGAQKPVIPTPHQEDSMFIYGNQKNPDAPVKGSPYVYELWTSPFDGSNQMKLLPVGKAAAVLATPNGATPVDDGTITMIAQECNYRGPLPGITLSDDQVTKLATQIQPVSADDVAQKTAAAITPAIQAIQVPKSGTIQLS